MTASWLEITFLPGLLCDPIATLRLVCTAFNNPFYKLLNEGHANAILWFQTDESREALCCKNPPLNINNLFVTRTWISLHIQDCLANDFLVEMKWLIFLFSTQKWAHAICMSCAKLYSVNDVTIWITATWYFSRVTRPGKGIEDERLLNNFGGWVICCFKHRYSS